jgi:hypothetical protein
MLGHRTSRSKAREVERLYVGLGKRWQITVRFVILELRFLTVT